MALPLKYNLANVVVRWRSTAATILGVALVVAVYVLVQALAVGLEASSRNTGDPRNMLVFRKGSTAESSSQVTREQFQLLPWLPQVARDPAGQPMLSADVVVLLNLPKKDRVSEANVTVRGVSPSGKFLRPQVRLSDGRWFTPGKREVVVGRRLAAIFADLEPGGTIHCGGKLLAVTGLTEAGNSAFDSEIWMDADEARSVFDRENYSSVLVRLTTPEAGPALRDRIENDKRLPLTAMPETQYYASQTMAAMPIRILGNFLATMMSVGAVFAAMNTMYATVGARTREVGTLRVLGFQRRAILIGFLVEGTTLALLGGVLGCLLALPMQGWSASTISLETFGETVFQFQITPVLAAKGLLFSALVGLAGSFLPAMRASRLPVIAALKSL
jgi:putative ABC transport system permease protein